jgi:hypothetical protein
VWGGRSDLVFVVAVIIVFVVAVIIVFFVAVIPFLLVFLVVPTFLLFLVLVVLLGFPLLLCSGAEHAPRYVLAHARSRVPRRAGSPRKHICRGGRRCRGLARPLALRRAARAQGGRGLRTFLLLVLGLAPAHRTRRGQRRQCRVRA